MKSLNKATLLGNVGQDPEVRSTGTGSRVATFSLATSARWKDKSGQQQEKTEWHRVVAWEGLADVVEKYVRKGDPVYVEGEINYRQYQDRDGATKYSTEIRARDIILLGGGQQQRPQETRTAPARGRSTGYDDYQAPPFEDDLDLPF